MHGHVLDVLKGFPPECVDVVVTSTPYWGLRDYGSECVTVWDGKAGCEHQWKDEETTFHSGTNAGKKQLTDEGSFHNNFIGKSDFCSKCGAWRGQLGLEPHPQMFIGHLVTIFNEVKRVLKPSGSLWLNLGDTYFGGNSHQDWSWKGHNSEYWKWGNKGEDKFNCKRPPADGKWLQPKQKMLIPARVAIALQDQGWILRNEVVWHKINHMPESCRDRLTRSWESVYFFTKSKRYYFDLDAIRKPHSRDWRFAGGSLTQTTKGVINSSRLETAINHKRYKDEEKSAQMNPFGANPGDVWTLTTEAFKGAHFATFPKKLVNRILKCACPRGGLVLDPFCGSGTALLVSHQMGFDWVGIDLNPDYVKMAENRILKHGKVRLDKYIGAPELLACNNSEAKT